MSDDQETEVVEETARAIDARRHPMAYVAVLIIVVVIILIGAFVIIKNGLDNSDNPPDVNPGNSAGGPITNQTPNSDHSQNNDTSDGSTNDDYVGRQ